MSSTLMGIRVGRAVAEVESDREVELEPEPKLLRMIDLVRGACSASGWCVLSLFSLGKQGFVRVDSCLNGRTYDSDMYIAFVS